MSDTLPLQVRTTVKAIVAWDDPKEAELMGLYLNLGDSEAVICTEMDQFQQRINESVWDVVLLAQTFPSAAEGFATFTAVKEALPGVPIVLGSRPDEVIGLPRFLVNGLRSYIPRDERGDYIFLLMTHLESAVAGARAERASLLTERLREEMDSVRRLQETIIPRDLRPQKGYRTVARYEPSEVSVSGGQPVVLAGGDYYDILPIDDSMLVALVGDASGHGLKACMSIMTMYTLIRMVTDDRYRDTAGFVTEINKRLCQNSIVQSGGGFITLFYAAIDIRAHEMLWASAGHPLALLHNLETDAVVPVGGNQDGGLPLGITAEMGYSSVVTPLPKRCRIAIYSDGLTDALCSRDGGTALFGVQGISETLQGCREKTLEETLECLFASSRSFTAGEGRHDDTSVVLIERTGEP